MRYPIVILLLFYTGLLSAQKNGQYPGALVVAFYNVENLFDTIDNPNTNDEEYLPDNGWTSQRYQHKISQLSKVIDTLGGIFASAYCKPGILKNKGPHSLGPDILGLCEVENKQVVEDLINTPLLSDEQYAVIHEDSDDPRGIDVAFVYRSNRFQVLEYKTFRLYMPDSQLVRTRDVLWVMGRVDQASGVADTMGFFVCHWPSRRGGERAARYRAYIAGRLDEITDSLAQIYPKATWVMMGDFNDEPSDESISISLGALANQDSACMLNKYFNPFFERERMGDGTYAYQQNWNQLDQIMIKGCFPGTSKFKPMGASAAVYRPHWIQSKHERYFGEPYRSFAGKNYLGGFSDHFPVFIIFCR